MSSTRHAAPAGSRTHRSSRQLLVLLLLGLSCVTGCGGCDQQTAAQKAKQLQKEKEAKLLADAEKKEQEKKKAPFKIEPLTPLLSESLIGTEEGRALRLAKPGHWTSAVQPMTANLADFEGRTTIAAVNSRGKRLPLPHTPFEMTSSRPAVLAKGRLKRIESELLVPADAKRLNVSTELAESSSGYTVEESRGSESWSLMPSYQYFVVVLAREPSRYGFLQKADAVKAPYEDENGASPPHYRVVLADSNKPLPLPPNVITWTSVAYLVWDDVNLDRMDTSQRQALVDWLHWGGRLIVNGPNSLESLRSSFLARYLPVDAGERRTIDAAGLAKFNDAWTTRRKSDKRVPAVNAVHPWAMVELKPRPHAIALPGCEGLFYEGPVGAGSIVVSAIQLAQRELVNWPGFDGFLNSALLRRPGRVFASQREGDWVAMQTDWADFENRSRDAYFTTPLRWFARDAATKANSRQVQTNESDVTASQQNQLYGIGGYALPEFETVTDRPGGLGDWNEFSPVSQAAREALVEAAGVRVPGAGFVVGCLAVYLVILVPLNWMIFNALGRIEWAWIAAPILALIGTIVVVRQAQLDIGFVRSQTEIALLELHGNHPRGHLTRYDALYSSLSTTYDVAFDDATAVATPFPRDEEFEQAIGDATRTVAFEKYDQPRLRGVTTSSASTQMIHSEQMVNLAGPVRLTTPGSTPHLRQLENKLGVDLSDAVVLRRRVDQSGKSVVDGCWLGRVQNGASVLLRWGDVAAAKNSLPFAKERAEAAAIDFHKRLNVDPLLKFAFEFASPGDPLHGRRDEFRLVARVDETLPGATASPAASQTTGTTVVLAHLELGPQPPPTLDANTPADVGASDRRTPFDEAMPEDGDDALEQVGAISP